MLNKRFGLCALTGFLALSFGPAWAQVARLDVRALGKQIEREFDPDAGGEAPYDPAGDEGQVAADENCEAIGGFTSTFNFSNRYRGNLYRIAENGVFLREIKMQLAFAGTANFWVSVHKKLDNGSYEEVDINNSSPTQSYLFLGDAQGLGANSAAFYSTGQINNGLGVELVPGDYAIGFSWGIETIKFGRDAGTYPKPISVGSTLASVSENLTPPGEPPLAPTLASLTQFTGGAYSMELCFVPTEGACCLSDGVNSHCVNVLEADCVGDGSFFHGQRTTCKDTICEFGACCFDCDTAINGFVAKCRDNYVTESCVAATGSIGFQVGAVCPADGSELCPKLVGACCNGTTCSLKCETECAAAGGVYQGDGTDCDQNTHKCKGACCVTGGCLDRTQAGCTASNGAYHGDGTRCFTEQCGGACCYGFTGLDFCEVFDQRELCAWDPRNFPKMVYRGDGTICPRPDPPFNEDCGLETQYKSCCLPDGVCINTTSAVCNATWINGSFDPTKTCETAPCTVERCCFGNGDCQELTPDACVDRTGVSGGPGTTCFATACNSIAGACCQPGVGACTMKSPAQCNAEGGFYRGDESNCSDASGTCPGFGACCRGNGECVENQTQEQCTLLNGGFRGAGSTCVTQDCDQRGACCAVTGTCLLTTTGTCAGIGGEFTCVGDTCAPGVCVSGACCLPGEGCKKRTPLACSQQGGAFRGANTSCTLQTCSVEGACCDGTTCAVATASNCTTPMVFLGAGTSCSTNLCVSGACCRIGGTCDETLQGDCRVNGETFTAEQTCLGVSCIPKGACCVGEACSITTLEACEAPEGQFKGVGVECDLETCAPTGACCTGSSCTLTTQVACGLSGGRYRGHGTSCQPNVCLVSDCEVTGACCTAGGCMESVAANCNGTYQGDGVPCGPTTCGALPTGACCTGSNCSIETSSDCGAGGGTYQGNNSLCSPNPCPPTPTGACCNGTVCSTTTQAACTGTYKGDNEPCDPDPCQVGPQCTAIIGTSPANCSIDARRPYPPNNASSPEGALSIDLTFDCDTSGHAAGDYNVTVQPSGTAPPISSVTPNGTTVTLDLSTPIPPGAWTCFTYTPANLTRCVGFLPGDVGGNGAVAPADILDLIDNLNGIRVPPLASNQCDIDRSDACAPADILTLIDLLNGTNGFIVWNGQTLPACPSAP